MNILTVTNPKIFNNQPTSFHIPDTEKIIKDQLQEVFVDEHYKKGKVKKNMVILDVGANIGSTALYFKDNAKVIYALEPNPKNYECLVENTKQFKNIKPFCIGLAARTATEMLKSNGGYGVAESLFGEGNIKTEVSLYAIDQFVEEQNIKHIDLLKMDTEGSEYLIFPSNGFSTVADKIDYIVGEAHYQGRLIPDFIPEILKDYGFELKWQPYNNMFLTLNFDDVVKREYKIMRQTIFFAWRKGLKHD